MTMTETRPDFGALTESGIEALAKELARSYDGLTEEEREAQMEKVGFGVGAVALTEREAHDFFAVEWNTPFGD